MAWRGGGGPGGRTRPAFLTSFAKGVAPSRVAVRLTGLLHLACGKDEIVFDLPPGATVGDALRLVVEAVGSASGSETRPTGGDRAVANDPLAGYFVVLETPGERARSLGPDVASASTTPLPDGSSLALLYRFAGG